MFPATIGVDIAMLPTFAVQSSRPLRASTQTSLCANVVKSSDLPTSARPPLIFAFESYTHGVWAGPVAKTAFLPGEYWYVDQEDVCDAGGAPALRAEAAQADKAAAAASTAILTALRMPTPPAGVFEGIVRSPSGAGIPPTVARRLGLSGLLSKRRSG